MRPLRTVLAGTDFSPPSRDAVVRASMIAADTGARLELLHVVEKSALERLRTLMGEAADPIAARLLDQARDKLADQAAAIAAARHLVPGTHLATGPILEQVADQADALDADLVVVGVRGTGFMQRLLLGTTAERLLRKTLRPILVVKQVAHETYRQVLVPVDFSSLSVQSIRFAKALAPNAYLTLLHVFDVPFEGRLRFAGVEENTIRHYREIAQQQALQNAHDTAQAAGLAASEYQLLVCHGAAPLVILEKEEEVAADLIVMGKHGRGGSEELLLGSATKHILAEARCDLVVVR